MYKRQHLLTAVTLEEASDLVGTHLTPSYVIIEASKFPVAFGE